MRRGASSLLSGVGFVSSAATSLLSDRAQYSRWKPAVEALALFLKTSGIQLELSKSLTFRLLDYTVILGRIQRAALRGRDIRDLVLLSPSNSALDCFHPDEYLRYMRYATAVYGETMIRAAEMDVDGTIDTRLSSVALPRIAKHVGLEETDIVVLDVAYGGDSELLRHLVAVDHRHKKVVLAIRGSFSISEMVSDVAGFARPFCGGEAHSEMASMAERVWKVTGPTVRRLLKDNAGYELIITGHSLGAACACLLNILCHANSRQEIDGQRVRCFAYAPPPCYTPLDHAPEAVESCVALVHERDVVPFLSVDSVRHFFASIRAIEDPKIPWRRRFQLMAGYEEPGDDLIQAVQRANTMRLKPKEGAPVLAIPSAAVLWILETPDSEAYDAKVCDALKMATLGIQVDPNMLVHHFPPRYEHALYNLKR